MSTNTRYVSGDVGNHYLKVMLTTLGVPTHYICVNSGLMFDRPDKGILYSPTDDDVFYCKHGTKTWRDKSWFLHSKGSRPFNLNGTDFCKGDSAKGLLAFPTLIAAIWEHIEDGDTIILNASTQNIHTTRDLMISELEGTHTVTVNRQTKRFTIQKPEVLAEGVGALLTHKVKKNDLTLLLDIGGDTVIVSMFAGLKLSGDVIPVQGLGTNLFLSTAIGDEDICKVLGRNPYNMDEMTQIIRGEHASIKSEGKNFEPALKKLTSLWLDEIFQRVIDPYKLRLNEANLRLATGGGTLIPGMKEALKSKFFDTIKDGQKANVKGLHERLLSKNDIQPVEPVKSTKKKVSASNA